MAKPNQFTAIQMIDAIRATKGMITLAARQLGCAPNTVRRYIREYPTVAEAAHESHEQTGDEVELVLYDEAVKKRNTAALIFLAKTKYKDRGYTERIEIDVRLISLIKQIETLTSEQGIDAGELFNDLIAELSAANRSEDSRTS